VSLLDLLGEMPGRAGAAVDWQTAAKWLNEGYLTPTCEATKQVASAQRTAALYRGAGKEYVSKLIAEQFIDPHTQAAYQKWVEPAGSNNVTHRIANELATLYRRPAARTVEGSEANQTNYQTVQRLMRMDEIMLDVQRLTIVHRSSLIGPRVPAWSGLPRLEIVERHQFRPVAHPLEPTRLIAVILDQALTYPNALPNAEVPRWLVWTDTEWFWLSAAGHIIGTPTPNRYGRIPYVLAALNPPPGALVDSTSFQDVINAHLSVWFQQCLLLKESMAATKAPVLSGDTARAARGQVLDSTSVIELPEGVALTSHDTTMDMSVFRDNGDYTLERAAGNHGIPPAILHHAGATSGYEIELRHVGIRERRIEQEPTFREIERELAELTAIVIAADAPALKFSTEGWSLNYGEIQMPRSPKEELEIFEHGRTLGLTDTVEEEMRRDPDCSIAQAWDRILLRIENETKRIEAMRELMALSGAMGSEQNSEPEDDVAAEDQPAREEMQ
jgi:hypothetical protein